jgi:hypothetical protein
MDFGELSDALGNRAVWIYLSAVIVAVWEVATNTEFLEASVVTHFVAPIAQTAGLDLLTADVYRTCLRKILAERFLPLARMLRDACAVEPFEFEEHVADGVVDDLFDPIAQEPVTQGFRINGEGNTVLSLSNLLTWVLSNGLRNPAGYGSILSLQRVRHFGVAFPPVSPIFLEHVNMCDQVLSATLDAVAATDSLQAAHESVNRIVDDWQGKTEAERNDVLYGLSAFLDFWAVPFEPAAYAWLAASMGPPMQVGGIQLWVPGLPMVAALHIDIPVLDMQQLMGWADDIEDEEGMSEDDEENEDDDEEEAPPQPPFAGMA